MANSKELFVNINNWDDFTSTLENLNKKKKGDAFELLTKLYFKLSPKYSFYDEVWMLSEVPLSVIEELGIPSHDLGIDLIAKNGNEYHAIFYFTPILSKTTPFKNHFFVRSISTII